jgi:hypothetical protein
MIVNPFVHGGGQPCVEGANIVKCTNAVQADATKRDTKYTTENRVPNAKVDVNFHKRGLLVR